MLLFKLFKVCPLVLTLLDDGLLSLWVNGGKCPVNMGVGAVCIGVFDPYLKAITLYTECLVVTNSSKLFGWIRIFLNRVVTVRNISVLEAWIPGAWGAVQGRVDLAVIWEYATEAPVTAASLERAWIEVCQ